MPNQVDEKIKKERVREIINLSNELESIYYNKFLNKCIPVLIENEDEGLTSNYIKVKLDKKYQNGEEKRVKITKVSGLNCFGKVIIEDK